MSKAGNRRKIDYPFVAMPKSIFTQEFYKSPQLFIFLSWIFSRISFEKRSFPINNQIIELEVGEFIFGRKACSEEIGISEQSLRTMIKNLSFQKILQKSTAKSTNKFTVYKIFWGRFLNKCNHQIDQQETKTQPQDDHNQDEKIKSESKQDGLPFFSSDLFSKLTIDEQRAVLVLFNERNSKKPIENPIGWLKECIKNGWYKRIKDQSFTSSLCELHQKNNRKIAKNWIEQLEIEIRENVVIRKDLVEVMDFEGRSWQIFYHLPQEQFRSQLILSLKKVSSNISIK